MHPMIEVFKTDIRDRDHANNVVTLVHRYFRDYSVNFDLDDCDKIFRVKCNSGIVHIEPLIQFLKELECSAEVLQGDKVILRATTFKHVCL
jgi:hypothetical protein